MAFPERPSHSWDKWLFFNDFGVGSISTLQQTGVRIQNPGRVEESVLELDQHAADDSRGWPHYQQLVVDRAGFAWVAE